MAELLKSREVVEQTREKQRAEIGKLVKADGSIPKLVIIQIKDDPVINVYVNAKKKYGASIGAEVDIRKIEQKDAVAVIKTLNDDPSVHGMIVQLPITDIYQTDEIVNLVKKSKDVDGLADNSTFTPATPLAIMLLLAHYNVEFKGKKIVIVGRGSLVGAPIMKILDNRGVKYTNINSQTTNPDDVMIKADVIISATGIPGLVKAENIKTGSVVVDAGTATDSGKTVGDVDDAAYDREDISITPKFGGVGPLTVCALFSNLLVAYKNQKGV